MKKVLVALLLAVTLFGFVACSQDDAGGYNIRVVRNGRSFTATLNYGNQPLDSSTCPYPLAYKFESTSDPTKTVSGYITSGEQYEVDALYDYVVIRAISITSKSSVPTVIDEISFSVSPETDYDLAISQDLFDSTFTVTLSSKGKDVVGNYKLHYRFINADKTNADKGSDPYGWRCIKDYQNSEEKIYTSTLLEKLLDNDRTRKTEVELWAELEDGTRIYSKNEPKKILLKYNRIAVDWDPSDNSFVPSMGTFTYDNNTKVETRLTEYDAVNQKDYGILYMVNLPQMDYELPYDDTDPAYDAFFNGSIGLYNPEKKVYLKPFEMDTLKSEIDWDIDLDASMVTALALPKNNAGDLSIKNFANLTELTNFIKKTLFEVLVNVDLYDYLKNAEDWTEFLENLEEGLLQLVMSPSDVYEKLITRFDILNNTLVEPGRLFEVRAELHSLTDIEEYKELYCEEYGADGYQARIEELKEEIEIVMAEYDNEVASLLSFLNICGFDLQLITGVTKPVYPKYSIQYTKGRGNEITPVLYVQTSEDSEATPVGLNSYNHIYYIEGSENIAILEKAANDLKSPEAIGSRLYTLMNLWDDNDAWPWYWYPCVEDVLEIYEGISDYASLTDLDKRTIHAGTHDTGILFIATTGLPGTADERLVACELVELGETDIQKELDEAQLIYKANWYWDAEDNIALSGEMIPYTSNDLNMSTTSKNRFLYYPTFDKSAEIFLESLEGVDLGDDDGLVQRAKNSAVNPLYGTEANGYYIDIPQFGEGYTTYIIDYNLVSGSDLSGEGAASTRYRINEMASMFDVGHNSYHSKYENGYVITADDYYYSIWATVTDVMINHEEIEEAPVYMLDCISFTEYLNGLGKMKSTDTYKEMICIVVVDSEGKKVASRFETISVSNLPRFVSEFVNIPGYQSPNYLDTYMYLDR